MFIESLNGSPETRKNYTKWLKRYMQYYSCTRPDELFFDSNTKTIENKITSFFTHKRNVEGKSPKTIQLYYTAIKHFYQINDIVLNWSKIRLFVGRGRIKKAHDRAYKPEEIRQILQKCDERKRVIVLLLASTGMRVGALPGLKVGDLEYQDKHGIYKINVYSDSENEDDKYITYCSKECAEAINSYLAYRQRSGEQIDNSSPLIRDQFNPKYANKPRKMALDTIISIVHRTITDTGIRDDKQIKKLGDRHSVMQLHGFRKFTKTQMTFAGVDHIYSETILGHIRRGLVGIYNTVSEQDLLENYLKAEAKLTIGSTEEEHLRKQVESSQEQINYVTKGIQEKYEKKIYELEQKLKHDKENYVTLEMLQKIAEDPEVFGNILDSAMRRRRASK
jgi:integrase